MHIYYSVYPEYDTTYDSRRNCAGTGVAGMYPGISRT